MIIRFVKMLLRCVFCWREKYATKEQIKNAQAIVAFSFGARRCGPGHSNAFLIKIASCLSRKYELPIIAQSNIGDHISNSVYTIRESRIPGQYLDTYEVAFQIYAFPYDRYALAMPDRQRYSFQNHQAAVTGLRCRK